MIFFLLVLAREKDSEWNNQENFFKHIFTFYKQRICIRIVGRKKSDHHSVGHKPNF